MLWFVHCYDSDFVFLHDYCWDIEKEEGSDETTFWMRKEGRWWRLVGGGKTQRGCGLGDPGTLYSLSPLLPWRMLFLLLFSATVYWIVLDYFFSFLCCCLERYAWLPWANVETWFWLASFFLFLTLLLYAFRCFLLASDEIIWGLMVCLLLFWHWFWFYWFCAVGRVLEWFRPCLMYYAGSSFEMV